MGEVRTEAAPKYIQSVSRNARRFISICNRVANSGAYNFQLCRIPVASELNLEGFRWHFANSVDQEVLEFLEFGFPINCTGEWEARQETPNHKGATLFPGDLDEYIQEETSKNRMVGPFETSPFNKPIVISPLNTREKRDSSERRIILDLTFPGEKSVNTAISKEEYLGKPISLRYPTVDDLTYWINRIGPGCCLFKRDLKKAYRQLPIDPGDVHKLAYKWNGFIYADRVLSMGLRSAAYICQRVSDGVMNVYKEWGYRGVVYLDDFAGVARADKAEEAFRKLGELLQELGLQESANKACPPSTGMSFLGIWFDTERMTMEVTRDRLIEIRAELGKWAQKKTAKKREIQSLIGLLSFAAKCVRPGRLLISRMLEVMKQCPEKGFVELDAEFLKDVRWWERVMPTFNGVSLIPSNNWSEVDQELACDACLTGAGGVCGGEFFHCCFPEFIMVETKDINQRELVTIMAALKQWCRVLKGKRLKIFCDNMVTVQVIMSGRAKNKFMQDCLREITFTCAVWEFEIQTKHIAGEENRLPDWLSRFHLDRKYREMFEKEREKRGLREIKIPQHYFKVENPW